MDLVHYNTKQPHQGWMIEGRTPLAQFKLGKTKAIAATMENTPQAA